jgi:hypothetical protein
MSELRLTDNQMYGAYELGKMRCPNTEGEVDWHQFIQCAEYTNTILPKLRQVAGYEDAGFGTYQMVPPDADMTDLRVDLNTLIDCFRAGLEGRELDSVIGDL